MISPPGIPAGSVLNYEAHRDIDTTTATSARTRRSSRSPQENADNLANEHEALKFGNGTHAASLAIDYQPELGGLGHVPQPTAAGQDPQPPGHRPDDAATTRRPTRATTSSRSSARVSNGPRAGYPQLTIPMGYNATQRRTLNVSIHGNAYNERDLIGVAYVIEQATKLRKPVSRDQPEHVPLRAHRPGAARSPSAARATRTTSRR